LGPPVHRYAWRRSLYSHASRRGSARHFSRYVLDAADSGIEYTCSDLYILIALLLTRYLQFYYGWFTRVKNSNLGERTLNIDTHVKICCTVYVSFYVQGLKKMNVVYGNVLRPSNIQTEARASASHTREPHEFHDPSKSIRLSNDGVTRKNNEGVITVIYRLTNLDVHFFP
jgi:hypothetical protein